jgi:hypothetical protein
MAVLVHRVLGAVPELTTWMMLNEMAALAIGILLLGTGMVFQLRATTMTGTVTMLAYFVSLVFFIRIPERAQHVAIYTTTAGILLFAIGTALSVYRDRLLALPEKVAQRKGVFRVLNWR